MSYVNIIIDMNLIVFLTSQNYNHSHVLKIILPIFLDYIKLFITVHLYH
jgi:hypothetical protein